jgi:predicted small lipoprotein YifL
MFREELSMKMYKKVFIGILAGVLALSFTLTGCGKKGSISLGAGESAAKTAAEAPRVDNNPLTIEAGVTEIPDNYLWQFHKGKNYTSVIIPEGVTKIGKDAFIVPGGSKAVKKNQHGSILTVKLPSTLKEIGQGAFYGQSLEEVNIPAGVTKIGTRAFYYNLLKTITVPERVKTIPRGFCGANENLTSITIPSTVTKIDAQAFSGCTGLNNVVIPASVTQIGNSAFAYCTKLNTVTFKGSAIELGGGVFYGCAFTSLPALPKHLSASILGKMEDDSPQYPRSSVAINNFGRANALPQGIFGKNKITTVVIPSGITTVGSDAFYDNPLEKVTLPASVKHVMMGAFAEQDGDKAKLKTIILQSNIKVYGESANAGRGGVAAGVGAVVGTVAMGPLGLVLALQGLNAAEGSQGKYAFPYNFMQTYQGLYKGKSGLYTYDGTTWKWSAK